jgi:hypothetical protein
MGPTGGMTMGITDEGKYSHSGKDSAAREEAMRFLDSEEGRDLLEGVTSTDEGIRGDTRTKLFGRAQQLLARADTDNKLSRMEEGELMGVQSVLMTDRLATLASKYGGAANIPKEVLEAAGREFKGAGITSGEQFLQRASTGPKLLLQKQREARAMYFKTARSEGQDRIRSLVKGGILTSEGISADMDKALAGIGTVTAADGEGDLSAGQRALRQYVAAQQARSQMGAGTGNVTDGRNQELELAAQGSMGDLRDTLVGMSVKEGRAFAATIQDKHLKTLAMQTTSVMERIERGAGRGGRAGAIAAISGILGTGLSTKDLKGKSAAEQADILESSLTAGLSAEDFAGEELSDIDSKLRLATDPTERAELSAKRDKLIKGAQGKLEAITLSTQRMRGAILGIESGDKDKVRAGKELLTKETQSLQSAGIVAAEKRQDAAAKENDPGFRKLNDIATHTKDMITAINRMSVSVVEAFKGGAKDQPPGQEG